ncbi:hypothetical protein G9F72_024015 [Clostridium estertheticum]|uniref:hypothetical protein n=1 Tax=Clostridium estertheticum TaxID=238834 RepID=UPI0013E9452C|nr:hypothetical protein [Clostridium estertheticum]MBZ9689367.1 hypothetical protein [Clostridium estertheticum]
MASLIEKNSNCETVLPARKKTTMPPEMFENEIIRNKELLKLLGLNNNNNNNNNNNEPLILTITSIYKDKESCYSGDYREREIYNHKNKLIAKYKENKDLFNAFVEGYLNALSDNRIKYEINEEVFVD